MNRNQLEAAEKRARPFAARGRPVRTLPGSHVADLVSLGKAVVLCVHCESKFAHNRHGYERRTVVPSADYVIGDCDGCRNRNARCTLYLKRENGA